MTRGLLSGALWGALVAALLLAAAALVIDARRNGAVRLGPLPPGLDAPAGPDAAVLSLIASVQPPRRPDFGGDPAVLRRPPILPALRRPGPPPAALVPPRTAAAAEAHTLGAQHRPVPEPRGPVAPAAAERLAVRTDVPRPPLSPGRPGVLLPPAPGLGRSAGPVAQAPSLAGLLPPAARDSRLERLAPNGPAVSRAAAPDAPRKAPVPVPETPRQPVDGVADGSGPREAGLGAHATPPRTDRPAALDVAGGDQPPTMVQAMTPPPSPAPSVPPVLPRSGLASGSGPDALTLPVQVEMVRRQVMPAPVPPAPPVARAAGAGALANTATPAVPAAGLAPLRSSPSGGVLALSATAPGAAAEAARLSATDAAATTPPRSAPAQVADPGVGPDPALPPAPPPAWMAVPAPSGGELVVLVQGGEGALPGWSAGRVAVPGTAASDATVLMLPEGAGPDELSRLVAELRANPSLRAVLVRGMQDAAAEAALLDALRDSGRTLLARPEAGALLARARARSVPAWPVYAEIGPPSAAVDTLIGAMRRAVRDGRAVVLVDAASASSVEDYLAAPDPAGARPALLSP